jgi:hypothetical protein
VTETIAEGLSVFGLVVGFPLLLLALMISLERLETWGLRPIDDEPDRDAELVEAAVESVEHRTVPVAAVDGAAAQPPRVAGSQDPPGASAGSRSTDASAGSRSTDASAGSDSTDARQVAAPAPREGGLDS